MKLPFLKQKIKQAEPKRRLLAVKSGERLEDGRIDFDLEVEIGGVRRNYPYTYDVADDDPITVQLTEWLRRNKTTADRFPLRRTVVSANDVKQEAARRIRRIIPQWKIERALTGGKPVAAADQKAAQAVRDASDRLERMSPIPSDYTDDKHWS